MIGCGELQWNGPLMLDFPQGRSWALSASRSGSLAGSLIASGRGGALILGTDETTDPARPGGVTWLLSEK